jgi:SprT protein
LLQQNQVIDRIQAKSAEYFLLWDMPDIVGSVVIQFSDQLRATLGRTHVNVRKVRLNSLLVCVNEKILDEVLCHECAHIAVYERFGRIAKPHGPEWAALLRQAGYEPRLRISIGGAWQSTTAGRFEHLCPVCQTVRYAKRPVTRWRCGSCFEAGLEGQLLIRRVGKE